MNPFLRYLADKNSAHTQTDRQTDIQTHTHTQTDRHTPLTTRPCGLRRAGNKLAGPGGDILCLHAHSLLSYSLHTE